MKPKNIRCCVSCRKSGPKTEFWRVVRCHTTGSVLIDRGMGRSAYLCQTQTCLEVAKKKRRLSRSLKTSINPDIYQVLLKRLED